MECVPILSSLHIFYSSRIFSEDRFWNETVVALKTSFSHSQVLAVNI